MSARARFSRSYGATVAQAESAMATSAQPQITDRDKEDRASRGATALIRNEDSLVFSGTRAIGARPWVLRIMLLGYVTTNARLNPDTNETHRAS